MTTRVFLFFSILLTALLAVTGCMVVTDSSAPYGRVGVALADPDVDLALWQAPEILSEYALQGSVQGSEQNLRLFRYVSTVRPEEILELSIYPIPGGWEDLPPIRMVEGHFPQAREAELRRIQRHSQTDVTETLHQSTANEAFKYPVAISEMHSQGGRQSMSSLLMLTADKPVFIRLHLHSKDDDLMSRSEQMIQLLVAFRDGLQRHAE